MYGSKGGHNGPDEKSDILLNEQDIKYILVNVYNKTK
jgi:hypothetical protein